MEGTDSHSTKLNRSMSPMSSNRLKITSSPIRHDHYVEMLSCLGNFAVLRRLV